MLRLSNPNLPAGEQDFPSDYGRLTQLYSDSTNREWGGILVQVSAGANYPDGAEAVGLGDPVTKGFFHPVQLPQVFTSFSFPGFRDAGFPSRLCADQFWVNEQNIGFYSRSSLEGTIQLTIEEVERYRDLSPTNQVRLNFPGITPTRVVSNGYVYEEGAGENQWQYADPFLTITTTVSSQIQPNQEVCVSGVLDVVVDPPTLQIVTFNIDPDDAILAVDYFGQSYTGAVNNYDPQEGEFTVSNSGKLNLYASINVLLPSPPEEQPRKNLVVNTGILTYPRPTS